MGEIAVVQQRLDFRVTCLQLGLCQEPLQFGNSIGFRVKQAVADRQLRARIEWKSGSCGLCVAGGRVGTRAPYSSRYLESSSRNPASASTMVSISSCDRARSADRRGYIILSLT